MGRSTSTLSSSERLAESGAPGESHGLAPWAWRLLILVVVMLAVYVSVGRYAMSQIGAVQPSIVAQLNARLPFDLSVEQVSGDWTAFSPELSFRNVLVTQPGSDAPPLAIGQGAIRIDVPASVSAGSLQLSSLEISGLNLDARLADSGTIEILGFSGGGGGALQQWLAEFLPSVEHVALTDNILRLHGSTAPQEVGLELHLQRDGNARRLQGQILGEHLQLAVNAQGVGNPLKPLSWSGDIFVDIGSDDLQALSSLWQSLEWPVSLSGAAAAQFWLNREEGESTARLRWSGNGLELRERDDAWALPLDAMSFEAAVDQRRNHWTLLAEDFHVEREGQSLDLDRVQFDWWGQSLRARVGELGLDALPTLLGAAPGVPSGLRDALPVLSPTGRMHSIELRLDDLRAPAQSWSLRSVLDDLGIESYRRSPALSGVSGYLSLDASGGRLQLDSDDFSMFFPTAYREPMRYDDAYGTVDVEWDRGALRLSSGLMHLRGEEGEGAGIFAVDIPFAQRPTKVELDLLVGLEDTRAVFREKYLPYRLPETLQDWLGRAIGPASIRDAGFVWRGSTARDQAQHRTIQLYLKTEDAVLDYDPAWPRMDQLRATAWVDDRYFWARSDRARIADTPLSDLMVRLAPETNGVRLDLEAHLAGDAGAAEILLTDTPLAELTDRVFADWEFSGAVEGDLAISLPISAEADEPDVSLALDLDQVDVVMTPLRLPLRNVTGELHYASATGFAGSSATGALLGGEVRGETLESEGDLLRMAIEATTDATAVADWLRLPLLHFAEGVASLEGELRVPDRGSVGGGSGDGADDAADEGRDTPSSLTLQSDLVGVALDVPAPFGKAAEQPLPLSLSMPLGSDPTITLALGERLRMALVSQNDEMRHLAATLGGGTPDPENCDVRYCLDGSISSLDLTAWSNFYQRYIVRPAQAATAQLEELAVGEVVQTDTVDDYRVDSLQVGELSLGGRALGSSRVDVWGRDTLWQGALEAGWVQGALTRRDGGLHLMIEYLDLARLEGGESPDLLELREAVPPMRVDVLEVRNDGAQWGSLGFELDTMRPDGAIYASAIEGNLWGMQLDSPMPAMLAWGGDPGDEHTLLELDASFSNVGEVLSAAGYEPTLESEAGAAMVRLHWPGSPADFSIASARGNIVMSAREGRVLETRPGALALVGFLNLAEILRGLSLAHMFESGIPFETAATRLLLDAGTLEVQVLEIDGATSAFAFSGVSDLQGGSIDGELVVTLPVANNLPWVAALAGGLPVAAGVFVVSKVFEKQVNRVASAVYGVSGEIDSPQVEFRRLFDDQVNATPGGP